jgi:hypothetical protein
MGSVLNLDRRNRNNNTDEVYILDFEREVLSKVTFDKTSQKRLIFVSIASNKSDLARFLNRNNIFSGVNYISPPLFRTRFE